MVTSMTHSTHERSCCIQIRRYAYKRLSLFLPMAFLLSLQCFDPSKANFVENLYKSLIDLPLISMPRNSRLDAALCDCLRWLGIGVGARPVFAFLRILDI
ncbi:hypothetical protein YC2023_103411 [Brassica napus]